METVEAIILAAFDVAFFLTHSVVDHAICASTNFLFTVLTIKQTIRIITIFITLAIPDPSHRTPKGAQIIAVVAIKVAVLVETCLVTQAVVQHVMETPRSTIFVAVTCIPVAYIVVAFGVTVAISLPA